MAAAIQTMMLDIVSAERAIFSGEVNSIEVTGSEGELGIHAGHTPLLTEIKPGQLIAHMPNAQQEIFYLSGGMLEVQPGTVTVLADTAARADDLDEAAAIRAKEQAEAALSDKQSEMDYTRALADLAQAAAQIRAIAALRRHKR